MRNKTRVLVYGAGVNGKQLCNVIDKRYEIVNYIDSDASKWGNKIQRYEIKNPDECLSKDDFEFIILASTTGYDSQKKKCFEFGIDEARIIDSYIIQPIQSRIQFVRNWADLYSNVDGACCEIGVFQGDFARHINEIFSDSKLYLCDTFSGFVEEDVRKEQEGVYSKANVGDYCYSSEELVLNKMPYPQNVHIIKGYFPDVAKNRGMEQEKFKFVNLDVDLYQPTRNSLEWLRKKMVEGGVILVHDFFADTFLGPRKAVEEFLNNYPQYKLLPIGDGISIAIVGFGGKNSKCV